MNLSFDCVLTATDTNKMYIEFIPIFIKMWKKLYPSIDIVIVLISDFIPDEYLEYSEYIILFKPITEIPTSFISQYIRILYPSILKKYKGGILITDMDMLPMNNVYYHKYIENIDNNHFVNYRKNAYQNMYPICYNIATQKVWSELVNIYSEEDIYNRLIEAYKSVCNKSKYHIWFKDQHDLHEKIQLWNQSTHKFIVLEDELCNFQRLYEFQDIEINKNKILKITSGHYSDFHSKRPYSKYASIIEKIFNALPSSKKNYL